MFAKDCLQGKVALITGGGTGIGLEIARQYVALGARVVLASRNEERLVQAVSELGGEAVALASRTDVRNYAEVEKTIIAAAERFGGLDILVNNAAGNFYCPTAELSPNGWRTVVDIDLNGTFFCCRAAYPLLKAAKGGGNIISIITMNAVTGWPGAAHAAAAKAGILSLSRSLAVEWAPDNIRVNTISPGPIADTEGVRRLYEAQQKADLERKRVALGRFGKATDIANAAVFLASPLADYVTGENLIVDGGRWLKYIAA